MTQTTQATGTGEAVRAARATQPSGLVYQAIPAGELDAVRAAGRDEAGNPLTVLQEDGGYPLRCCLREAWPGERLLLIAYTPPGTAGAYAERGPVFIHADRCEGYLTPHDYPPALAHRQQVVRAYDRQGRIADGVLVADGRQAQDVIADLLARPGVELVHLRNVGYGCYNFGVRSNGKPAKAVAAENLADRGHPALRASGAGVHAGADRRRPDGMGIDRPIRGVVAAPVPAGRPGC